MVEGQKTWYDYPGKTYNMCEGTQSSPLFVARLLPDGTTWFTRTDRNAFGNVLTNVSTYSGGSGVALRTNTFTYDAVSGINLITAVDALGIQVSSNSYNAYNQVLTNYDALNQMTVYVYNGSQQIASSTSPTGLISTNIYESDGQLATNYCYAISGGATVYFWTNSYTYSNALVITHTDPRGLTTTNTWDNLQRLRRVDYPDGTFITNTYQNLDLARIVDRMGFTNAYGYDSMRRRIAETNALGNYTSYTYCNCGSLENMRDALGNFTYYYYNNAGWRTNTVFPDGYSITNNFDLLHRLTNRIDSAGVSVTNWINNQGLTYAVSNYFGQISARVLDRDDRTVTNTDVNTVTVVIAFDNLGRVISRSYPDGGAESFGYSAAGLIRYTNQLSEITAYGYDAASRKVAVTNANIETTLYTYSPAADLLTLTDGKSQTTAWSYTIYGMVSNKLDAASNLIFWYQYDADNRVTNRWTPVNTNTTCRYDSIGNLLSVIYFNPYPATNTYAYDALNRLTSMIDAVGTTAYSYDPAGQLLSEAGPWSADTVNYFYNNRLREAMSVEQPNADPWLQTYAYDGARRLTNTTSPAGSFGYLYDGARQLKIGRLSLPNDSFITNTFDSMARMLSTKLLNPGGTNLNSHAYTYDHANQRTSQTRTAGDYVNYAYDSIGQLTQALGYETNGTGRLNETLGYGYDAAHNLNLRTNNALIENFTVNSLNELSNATHTGTLTVAGTTGAKATNVTVNGSAATLYNDNTFALAGFTATNGNNSFTAIAHDSLGRWSTNTVTAYLPTPVVYTYDLNGNLLSDGTRNFVYDGENQLIVVYVTNTWQSQFIYDGKLRRRIRKESTWQGGVWRQTNEVHYVYDGNLVVQERDINNLPGLTYTRGTDLGGSLQGAGGIGGLLAFSLPSIVNPRHFYYHADGNGNVTALVNVDQLIVAKYLYDPYGNILSASGSLAIANLYRFSSKEFQANLGSVYYLYRYYDPNIQRWLNRDPAEERAGLDLYSFIQNEPLSSIDAFGLSQVCPRDHKPCGKLLDDDGGDEMGPPPPDNCYHTYRYTIDWTNPIIRDAYWARPISGDPGPPRKGVKGSLIYPLDPKYSYDFGWSFELGGEAGSTGSGGIITYQRFFYLYLPCRVPCPAQLFCGPAAGSKKRNEVGW